MEEQPIDNLFKRKLHDAEIKPSIGAWAALEAQRSPRRIIPVWTYMAVAASLLVAGAFGWWVMQSQDGTIVPNLVAVQIAKGSAAKNAVPQAQTVNNDRLTSTTINEQVQLIVSANQKRLRLPSKFQISHKSYTAPQRGANPEMQINTQQVDVIADKTDTPRFDPKPISESIPEVAVTKEIPKGMTASTPERTLIVSIDVPDKGVQLPNVSVVDNDNAGSKTGLGGLLKKVKRLMDGDVFALSATTAKTNRRGLGKFYDDVKESIKNNSAD